MINDILDLSKVEAGKLELDLAEINLRPVLENSLTMVKEKALKKPLQLSIKLDGIPDSIRADERKLKQVLYNLLANAVKFTPEGGKIVLAARPLVYAQNRWATREGKDLQIPFRDGAAGEYVEVSVQDTGIGLKKEDLERISAPFEQGDNSASRQFQGIGLGLSLTRQLVELHAGKIWAESEGLDKGSAFRFVIPNHHILQEGRDLWNPTPS